MACKMIDQLVHWCLTVVQLYHAIACEMNRENMFTAEHTESKRDTN
jgi:hypothetical protein